MLSNPQIRERIWSMAFPFLVPFPCAWALPFGLNVNTYYFCFIFFANVYMYIYILCTKVFSKSNEYSTKYSE